MNYNQKLKDQVLEAISVEPLLNGVKLDVEADGGVITLSAKVDSYAKKRAAEQVARIVPGVRAVVEKIKVEFESIDRITDQALICEVLHALKLCPDIFEDDIKVIVENGRITLAGNVKSITQKDQAESAIYPIAGVRMVTNNIAVIVESDDDVEKAIIQEDLLRNWVIDHQDIEVSVLGNQVTLNGKVQSLYQSDVAERIAWNSPGVCNVHNRLTIR